MAKNKVGVHGSDEETGRTKEKGGKKCPVTVEQFNEAAKDIVLNIEGQTVVAGMKEFSTGSFGWNANGKIMVKVGDVQVPVQVGINMTVVGSKPGKD